MKRKIPGMIAGMFFLLCTLEAFGIKNKQITVLPPGQKESQQEAGNQNEKRVETDGNAYKNSKKERSQERPEQEEAQAVTAEAARRIRKEYNISVLSVLLALTLIMLVLLIKKPAGKRK